MENSLYDAIVVGGGLGGLTAAAFVAKAGKSVLVIEQHNVVGGSTTIFKRKKLHTIEVGLHELDNAMDKSLFRKLGLYDQLEFVKAPEFYRFIKGGVDIVVPDGFENAERAFLAEFSRNNGEIQQFFQDIKNIRTESRRYSGSIFKKIFMGIGAPLTFKNLIKFRKFTVG